MEKPVIIVNPRAGGGLHEAKWARLAGPIADALGPFDVRFTEHPGHASAIAREEADGGRRLVVAVGGDGTVSEVVNGLMQAREPSATELGFIPHGTGGDFRRTMDLPREPGQAAVALSRARARPLDVGWARVTGPEGKSFERFFVNVASFGFSAAVADRANRGSKRLGARVAFLGATVKTLLSFSTFDARVRVDDGEEVQRRLLFGAVGNGRFFGGGMKICPNAELGDGLLEAVLVGDFGPLDIVLKTNRLYDGTHLDLAAVTHERATTLHVAAAEGERPIPVELDGETSGGGRLPASFAIRPGALRLRA